MNKEPIEGSSTKSSVAGSSEPQAALVKSSYRSPAESLELGKRIRLKLAREQHAAWLPPENRPNPVDLLEAQAATRIPELVPIRYGRMLVSPFAFYRGAAVIMAADLASMPDTGLRVQLCGDAHLSNFGGFASPERELFLDINDFDETLPGPWEWDVKRLVTSFEIAGRDRGFTKKIRHDILLAVAGEYHRSLNEFSKLKNLDLWYLHLDPQSIQARWGMFARPREVKILQAEFSTAYHRDNQRVFEKLTTRVNGKLQIAAHPPLVVPIEDLVSGTEGINVDKDIHPLIQGYLSSLTPDRRKLVEGYHYAHLARKVVGVGSVGTRTWIMLMLGRDEADPLVLQVKEAQASVLEAYLPKSIYAGNGKRVVEGQRMIQAASDIFLGWNRVPVGLDGKPHDYYIRQLWDWKISADIETMDPAEMQIYAHMCGWTLARAHARSGDRIAISGYLGKNEAFENALADFAVAYADQNERDYQLLKDAVKDKRIVAQTGV